VIGVHMIHNHTRHTFVIFFVGVDQFSRRLGKGKSEREEYSVWLWCSRPTVGEKADRIRRSNRIHWRWIRDDFRTRQHRAV